MRRLFIVLLLLTGTLYGQSTGNAYGNLLAASTDCSTVPCVSLGIRSSDSSAAIQLSGAFTGGVQFEATADGTNWASITPVAGPVLLPGSTSTGIWQFAVAGLSGLRVRPLIVSTGAIQVSINASSAPPPSRPPLKLGNF